MQRNEEIQLWQWRYTDDFGKRRLYPCRLSDTEALARLRDPEKVEGSLEWHRPLGHTSDFLKHWSPRDPGKP